jgi:curved DNA-binding protein CbpA
MAAKKTYYELLDIDPTASADEIRKAARLQLNAWHPDKFSGASKKQAEERTKEINAAHDVLKDPRKRAAYDRTLSQQGQAQQGQAEEDQQQAEEAQQTQEAARAAEQQHSQANQWQAGGPSLSDLRPATLGGLGGILVVLLLLVVGGIVIAAVSRTTPNTNTAALSPTSSSPKSSSTTSPSPTASSTMTQIN